jgi:hypothetical protein
MPPVPVALHDRSERRDARLATDRQGRQSEDPTPEPGRSRFVQSVSSDLKGKGIMAESIKQLVCRALSTIKTKTTITDAMKHVRRELGGIPERDDKQLRRMILSIFNTKDETGLPLWIGLPRVDRQPGRR